MQTHMEYLIQVVLKLEGFKCDLHVGQKMAFLFVQWGDGDSSDMGHDAHHKSKACMDMYNLDAKTLDEIQKANPDESNNVSEYKAI
jgi:hypothetical protein